MPSQRLLLMGLLSKYPNKSTVLKRFTDPNPSRFYTEYEKMHMVATWYTPGLSKEWLYEQFARYGMYRRQVKDRMDRIIYDPKYRDKYRHLGQQNILFLGQPEVERYFNRTDMKNLKVPQWALPIINDEIKRGLTQSEIGRKYKLGHDAVARALKRSMFEPSGHAGNRPPWLSPLKG